MTTQVDEELDVDVDEPSYRPFGVGLLVLGGIGLAAAFALTVDKIRILKDPDFVPGCDWNPAGPVLELLADAAPSRDRPRCRPRGGSVVTLR